MQVAPATGSRPQEVLVAISNFNLVRAGHLLVWLQVDTRPCFAGLARAWLLLWYKVCCCLLQPPSAEHSCGSCCAVAQTVKKAGIKNYLVVAIDAELRDYLTENGYNVYFRDITVSFAALT